MSHPDTGKGIEDHDPSYGNLVPLNNMRNGAESMQFGQNFDDRFLNGDSYSQGLYQLCPVIPGQVGTMDNTQAPSYGSSGTYVPASHYQVPMTGQSYPVHGSALLSPAFDNQQLDISASNGFDLAEFHDALPAHPTQLYLGDPNATPATFNDFQVGYHDENNAAGFSNFQAGYHDAYNAAACYDPDPTFYPDAFTTASNSFNYAGSHIPIHMSAGYATTNNHEQFSNPQSFNQQLIDPRLSNDHILNPGLSNNGSPTPTSINQMSSNPTLAVQVPNPHHTLQAQPNVVAGVAQSNVAVRVVSLIGTHLPPGAAPVRPTRIFTRSDPCTEAYQSAKDQAQEVLVECFPAAVDYAWYRAQAKYNQKVEHGATRDSTEVQTINRFLQCLQDESLAACAKSLGKFVEVLYANGIQVEVAAHAHYAFYQFLLSETAYLISQAKQQFVSDLQAAADYQFAAFRLFPRLPPEVRLIVWNMYLETVPSRIVRWAMDVPPAVVRSLPMEGRREWEKGCTAFKTQADKRVVLHIRPGDELYLEGVPGLIYQAGEVPSPDPVQMKSSPPLGTLMVRAGIAVGNFNDAPDPTSTPVFMGIDRITLPLSVAFVLLRAGAKSKADANWAKLSQLFPALTQIRLVSGPKPDPQATVADIVVIPYHRLSKIPGLPEQSWADKITEGYARNFPQGSSWSIQFEYVEFNNA